MDNSKDSENKYYLQWETAQYFEPQGQGESYCIMLPPPNVTGSLHMGHAFQQTLMDILIRYHRMQGRKTLWQAGTDHAGIATQMVVERQLQQTGQTRQALGREAFIERVWEWKKTSGNTITSQMRRMGVSIDWTREKFTMDPELSNAVTEVFVRLYEEGLIYRGKKLVNWDPVLLTAVSDLEVDSTEEQGQLWYIRYPLEKVEAGSSPKYIVVATTRPETMLGDVAVAVHPDDPRYQNLIGKNLKLPLTDRLIPIIADDQVLPDFGSGAVKITPAHDFNDHTMALRHHLPMISIFTEDAKLNTEAPLVYQGMDRFVARKKIIEDLKEQDLIEKIEPHVLSVPRGDRSGAILEPKLTDQWFVAVSELAKPAIEAVQSGKIKFVPENWSKTYFEWMNHIQDWCISRQIWWGHRIPAWYDEACKIYVGKTIESVREKYHLSKDIVLTQDNDVLDTWFSSALWPFSTLGWPEQTEAFKTFYPGQVLITGFDIIFFWVARMIMFGLKFTGNIPFETVYINGIILDQDGQKMSKTKGNVLDPLDLIDGIELETLVKKRTTGLMQPQLAEKIAKTTRSKYPKGIPAFGTDALRFTFAALATPSRYVRFDLNHMEKSRHFVNKLRNAARYVFLTLEKDNETSDKIYEKTDLWITSLWQTTKQTIHKQLSEFRFDLAALTLSEFAWNEYCDWYLELSKPILFNQEKPKSILNGTRYTLISILEELLRVLHPIMPYLTEELWQQVPVSIRGQSPSIMIAPYPHFEKNKIDPEAEAEINWLKSLILAIRNFRGENKISPAHKIPVIYFYKWNATDKLRITENKEFICFLAKIERIAFLEEGEKNQNHIEITTLANLEALAQKDDLSIDFTQEIGRLEKELDKLYKELEKSQKILSGDFRKNAPAHVVEQAEKRLLDIKTSIKNLETQKERHKQPLSP